MKSTRKRWTTFNRKRLVFRSRKVGMGKSIPEDEKRKSIATDTSLTWYQKLQAWQKAPQKWIGWRRGVVRVILEQLVEAGRRNEPITKQELLDVLVRKFPERSPDKMFTTIQNRISTQFRQLNGIHVWKQCIYGQIYGYYIVGNGKTPQKREERSGFGR